MNDISLNGGGAIVTENAATPDVATNNAATPESTVNNAVEGQGASQENGQNQGAENAALEAPKPMSEAQKQDLSPDWREKLPDLMRESAKDFDSVEALMDAVKRGAAYKPALKPEELEYAPEGVEMDPTAARQFRELGVKIGLTPEQAKALIDFEASAVAERARRNSDEGLAHLKQKWGAEYENNVQHAKRALLSLDNKTDGRISQLFGKDGLGSVPTLMEAFALIGKDMAEDSSAGAKSAAGSARESALGMFAGMFH